MRRIRAVFTLTALLLVAVAVPAFAEVEGPSACKEQEPGQYVSPKAQEGAHPGENNPGNAKNEYPPFVPFVSAFGHEACNPNAT